MKVNKALALCLLIGIFSVVSFVLSTNVTGPVIFEVKMLLPCFWRLKFSILEVLSTNIIELEFNLLSDIMTSYIINLFIHLKRCFFMLFFRWL